MPQVDIDFEVFKELTIRRPTEDVTYNDVIRGLLNLSARSQRGSVPPQRGNSQPPKGMSWVVGDTSIPAGSEFTADYKGKTYSGIVKDGKLVLSDGHTFATPSAAGVHITGSKVNGWRFWKCRLPSANQYVVLERLRKKTR